MTTVLGALRATTLEKLKIFAYLNPERQGFFAKTYEVMFNPESYSFTYTNDYQTSQGIKFQRIECSVCPSPVPGICL